MGSSGLSTRVDLHHLHDLLRSLLVITPPNSYIFLVAILNSRVLILEFWQLVLHLLPHFSLLFKQKVQVAHGFPDAITSLRRARLYQHLALLTVALEALQLEPLADQVVVSPGIFQVLFVQHHQDWDRFERGVLLEFLELLFVLEKSLVVASGVHHIYNGVNVIEVMLPELGGLPADVPHRDQVLAETNLLNVEADSRHRVGELVIFIL